MLVQVKLFCYVAIILLPLLINTLFRFKDNIMLEEGDKYEFSYDPHTCSATLYIKGITATDDGTYRCKVENGFGASSQTSELCVELKNR